MSVAMTTDAVIERRKTVTRRKGWTFLKPGDTLTLCRKVQGRKPGEPLERLAEVEVVCVNREPLSDLYSTESERNGYGAAEVAAEGFPGLEPVFFVRKFFEDAQGMDPADEVTRIEWRYLDCSRPEGSGNPGVTGAQPDEPATQAGRPATGGAL